MFPLHFSLADPLARAQSSALNAPNAFTKGAFGGGSVAAKLPLASHSAALAQCGLDEQHCAQYLAHVTGDRLLEKLLGETCVRQRARLGERATTGSRKETRFVPIVSPSLEENETHISILRFWSRFSRRCDVWSLGLLSSVPTHGID